MIAKISNIKIIFRFDIQRKLCSLFWENVNVAIILIRRGAIINY